MTMSLKNNSAMTTLRWPTRANSQWALWPGTLSFCLVSLQFFSLAVVLGSLCFPYFQHFTFTFVSWVCLFLLLHHFCDCSISLLQHFPVHLFNVSCVFFRFLHHFWVCTVWPFASPCRPLYSTHNIVLFFFFFGFFQNKIFYPTFRAGDDILFNTVFALNSLLAEV